MSDHDLSTLTLLNNISATPCYWLCSANATIRKWLTGQHENTCKLHEVLCASLVPCLAQTSEYTRIVQCTWNYTTGDQPRPAIFLFRTTRYGLADMWKEIKIAHRKIETRCRR